MRTRIKFCGFTRESDVRAALDLGVDAFGFNLARGPRKIAVDRAAALARLVTPPALSVALFVDAGEEEILAAMCATRCQAVQLSGDESPDLVQRLARRFPVIKAFRIGAPDDLAAIVGHPADVYLLDTAVAGTYGGTGTTWDHTWLSGRDLGHPMMLAGGLRPENVAAAVTAVRPFAVDTASGIESGPGLKDPQRMAAFVAAVHHRL